jgi:cAMP phosphodiesterase
MCKRTVKLSDLQPGDIVGDDTCNPRCCPGHNSKAMLTFVAALPYTPPQSELWKKYTHWPSTMYVFRDKDDNLFELVPRIDEDGVEQSKLAHVWRVDFDCPNLCQNTTSQIKEWGYHTSVLKP